MVEQLLVNAAIAILARVIKNPASVASEKAIVAHVAQVATDADNAVNGTGWTHA